MLPAAAKNWFKSQAVRDAQGCASEFWRHVDATAGQGVGTYGNLWNANDLSDGCFVEFMLLDGNTWQSVEPTNSRSQCGGQQSLAARSKNMGLRDLRER